METHIPTEDVRMPGPHSVVDVFACNKMSASQSRWIRYCPQTLCREARRVRVSSEHTRKFTGPLWLGLGSSLVVHPSPAGDVLFPSLSDRDSGGHASTQHVIYAKSFCIGARNPRRPLRYRPWRPFFFAHCFQCAKKKCFCFYPLRGEAVCCPFHTYL